MGDLKRVHREEYEVNSNWKLAFENFNECYHCASIHPGLAKLSPLRSAFNDLHTGPFLGGPMSLSYESMTSSGNRVAPIIRDLDEERSKNVYYYSLMPNMLMAPHPDFVLTWRMEPLAPGKVRVVSEWLFEPEAIEQPGFDPKEAVEFWDMTNRQDWVVCSQTFAGVSSRAYTPGPWAKNEQTPREFDREVLYLLGELERP